MKKLKFDTGLQSWQVGNGVLTFNPSDPNLYSRFLEAVEEMQKLTEQNALTPQQADQALRGHIRTIFPDTDVDAILPQNLLALCGNGKLLVLNFLEAVEAILVEGARAFAQS